MKLKGCHHIAVKTQNLASLSRFYQDVFGSAPIAHPFGKKDAVWFQIEEIILMLEESKEVSKTRSFSQEVKPGWHVVAFAIESKERQAWKDHLKRLRIPITEETSFSLYFSDPDGNRIALSHYPEMTK